MAAKCEEHEKSDSNRRAERLQIIYTAFKKVMHVKYDVIEFSEQFKT